MKPQWEFLKRKLKKINCNGVLLEIDASQLDYIDFSSLKNSINGFPSLMIFKKGKKLKIMMVIELVIICLNFLNHIY